MSMARLALLVVALCSLAGCPEAEPLPGDQLIGAFSFVAIQQRGPDGGFPCGALEEARVESFTFAGTLTRCTADAGTPACAGQPGGTFFSANGVHRPAAFDGQVVTVDEATARRTFSDCSCETELTERIAVALFSQSQAAAVGTPFQCPPDALDGGVPAPDGGIVPPGPTPGGFDAVRACGELVDEIVGVSGCTCPLTDGGTLLPEGRCQMTFRLSGERR